MSPTDKSSPTDKPKAGRQSDKTAEQSKLAIIEAATQEFAQHGFEGSSLRNIAKRAGATHGLIRHHFGSKEDVFYAVVDGAIDTFGQQEASIIAELNPEDFQDKDALIETHKEIMRMFARTAAKNPDMMRILLHEGIQKTDRLTYLFERIDQLNTMHAYFFDSMIEQGILINWEADQCFLYILINLGVVFGLTGVTSHYAGGDILSEDMVNSHAERMINLFYSSQ